MNAIARAIAAIPRPPVATFGAAVVASFLNAGAILAIAVLPWPDSVANDRIDALKWLGLSQTLLTAIVVISWAWGRPDTLAVSLAGQSVNLDFDRSTDDPAPPDK